MGTISITADSGVVAEYSGIPTIPLVIVDDTDNVAYRDQAEIDVRQVLHLREIGHEIRSSCMSPADMERFFEEQLQTSQQVLHLNITDKVSAGAFACSNMVAASLAPDRIRVVNTQQGGPGGVQVAGRALEAVDRFTEAEAFAQYLESEIIPRVITFLIVPDPSGYRRSGKGVMNTFMNIGLSVVTAGGGIPLVRLNNTGKMVPYGRQKPQQGESRYITFAKSVLKPDKMADRRVSVAYLDPDPDQLRELLDYLTAQGYEVTAARMGAIISCYACKDSLGISYLRKS